MKRHVRLEEVLGREVFVVLTEPDETTKRLVIMAHGFRGSSTGPARTFVDLERVLFADGISVLRFDQPGSGNSAGDFRDSSFDVWVDTIVELARRRLDEGYRVVLLGQSMGGAATMVAASRPALHGRIPAVILWAPGINDKDEYPGRDFIEPLDAEFVDEDGQRVRADFWREAHDAGFFAALDRYEGTVHLVFGEYDRFDPEAFGCTR